MKYITKCDFLSQKANFTFNEEGDIKYKTFIGNNKSIFSFMFIWIMYLFFNIFF